ncbi:MAG: hypothetical protein ACJA16_004083 [Akkermansiaceae bacterium]|jgi:hypothetical protein
MASPIAKVLVVEQVTVAVPFVLQPLRKGLPLPA